MLRVEAEFFIAEHVVDNLGEKVVVVGTVVDVSRGYGTIGQLTVDERLYCLLVAITDWIIPTYVAMSAGTHIFFTEIMELELAVADVVVGDILHH